MKYMTLFLVIGLIVSLNECSKLVKENNRLEGRVVEAEAKAASWHKLADEATDRTLAVHGVAEACLAREQAAQEEHDQWAKLIEKAKSRDLTTEEQGKVPDDNTRKDLIDSLDRPL